MERVGGGLRALLSSLIAGSVAAVLVVHAPSTIATAAIDPAVFKRFMASSRLLCSTLRPCDELALIGRIRDVEMRLAEVDVDAVVARILDAIVKQLERAFGCVPGVLSTPFPL